MPDTYIAECSRHGKGWKVLGVCKFQGFLRTLGCDVIPRSQTSASFLAWKREIQKIPNIVPVVYLEDMMAPGSWLQMVFVVDDDSQRESLSKRMIKNPRDICGYSLYGRWLDDLSQEEYHRLKKEYIDA